MSDSFLEAYLRVVDIFMATQEVFSMGFFNSKYLKYSEICGAAHKNGTFLL